MSYLLSFYKKSNKYLAYPFIFVSVFLLALNVINLFPFRLDVESENVFGACSIFFVSLYVSNAKKGIAGATAFLLGDSVYFALSSSHFSLLFGVFFAFLFALITKNIDLIYAYILLMVISFSVGLFLGLLNEYLLVVLKSVCNFMSNKAFLFGAFNNIYSIAIGDTFSEMLYTKDYSAATVVNNELAVGIKNVFLADTSNPPRLVASLMTGKYYLNLFVTLGVFLSLFSHFDGEVRLAFCLSCALAFAFGDVKLLSLFLFIYNPMIYLAFLGAIFVSYLVPSFLDIRIGFEQNGSLLELFKYGNSWGYFILSGIVIGVMSYFLVQTAISKFDIEKQKLLPKEVRKIVLALGGERNIEKIKSDSITVRNPNLINILKLDCEIHENEITLFEDDLELLKEYF